MTTYDNHSISFLETAMEDFGDPNTWKDFLEVQINFQPGSVGFVWVEAENEFGQRSGTTRRAPKPINTTRGNGPKFFLNLKGRRIKIRVWILTDNHFPWVQPDISVGWLVGVEN